MDKLVSTFSIVARDPATGQLGVAVESHAFAAGSLVPWAESGVGAVATQAHYDITYGPLGLDLMRAGKTAPQALAALLAADDKRDVRQVAMVDKEGNVAVHTGSRCIASAGHVMGENFSAQGNILANDTVWHKMADAFKNAHSSDLTGKLMEALEAGQDAGGDVRGMQAGGILVVAGPDDPLERKIITNIRVDDHDNPLVELRRVLTVSRGDEWLGMAELALRNHDLKQAKEYYEKLRGLVVGSREVHFWYATTLVEAGYVDEAIPIFAEVFAIEPLWHDMIDRLVSVGHFPNDKAVIERVKALPVKKKA
jgi:uncharacterized Ntn-hydrolase superfamily protein